jgi:hypothetical protein
VISREKTSVCFKFTDFSSCRNAQSYNSTVLKHCLVGKEATVYWDKPAKDRKVKELF